VRRDWTPSIRSVLTLTIAAAMGACSADAPKLAGNNDAGGGGGPAGSSGGVDAGPDGSAGGGGISGGAGNDAGAGSSTVDAGAGTDSGGGATDAGGGTDGGGATGGDGGRDLSANRAGFLGDSRCAAAGVQLCEDFESGMLNAATWMPLISGNGTMPFVDTLQAARGKHALHIVANGAGQASIAETKTFPEANDTYFGRAFYYFSSLPTSPPQAFAHFDVVAAIGTGVKGETKVFGMTNRMTNNLVFGVGTDAMGDLGGTHEVSILDNDPPGAAKPIPIKQWVCLEWMHKGDTKETRLWVDATEHPSLATSTTMNGAGGKLYALPQFTQVAIGWHEWQASALKFELWVDEIAIDKERIGCVL
jgi:hypothetical protein